MYPRGCYRLVRDAITIETDLLSLTFPPEELRRRQMVALTNCAIASAKVQAVVLA
jgi:hypothetical protein